jgi:hypothetical protein
MNINMYTVIIFLSGTKLLDVRARHRKRGRHAMTDTWQQRSLVQVPDQHGRVLRPTPASKTYTETPLAL